MQTFLLHRPNTVSQALGGWREGDTFIAGGTDLLQLMKSEVETPTRSSTWSS